jgi:hypothetical protein
MVVEILAYVWQVEDRLNPDLRKGLEVTDARVQQDVRRADRTRRKDDFFSRSELLTRFCSR